MAYDAVVAVAALPVQTNDVTAFDAQLLVPKKPTALLILLVKLLPLTLPATCNFALAVVVPIPTFPFNNAILLLVPPLSA